jgi:primase-polymerase (primpol)-like protein
MIQRPHTYIADLTNLPKALQPITQLKRWVVWRWELRTKKNGARAWTKPPYQCAYPNTKAKSDDPNTWGTYEAANCRCCSGPG